MYGLTIIEKKIMDFLVQQEKHDQAPDMLCIMNNITQQVKECKAIDVIDGVNCLHRRLKIIKTRVGFSITYRVVNNL